MCPCWGVCEWPGQHWAPHLWLLQPLVKEMSIWDESTPTSEKALAELLRFPEHLLFLGALMKSNDELPFLGKNLISYPGKGNVQCLSHPRTLAALAQFGDTWMSPFNTAAFFQITSLFLNPSGRSLTLTSYWWFLILLQPAAQLTPLKEVPAGQKHNSFFSPQHVDRKTFHSSHPSFLCGPKQPCLITTDQSSLHQSSMDSWTEPLPSVLGKYQGQHLLFHFCCTTTLP